MPKQRNNAVIAVLISCGLIFGQTPAFEVVSIRPGAQGTFSSLARAGKLRRTVDDAQIDFATIPLSELIQTAYDLPADQVSGPKWLDEARFDVQARLPAGAGKKDVPRMLQTMLADRFKMTVHHEQKAMQVYALMIGKGTPKFTESVADDATKPDCTGAPGQRICRKMSMEELASMLSAYRANDGDQSSVWLDRPVVDATGLKGLWDFPLNFGRQGGRGSGSEAISVTDAVKDIGLRLDPQKHTFDTIVIDHIERVPTEN